MIGSRFTPNLVVTDANGKPTTQFYRFVAELVDWINDDAREAVLVADLPTTAKIGSERFCSNESGGAVPVFFDGTNWRRVTDRAVAS